MSSKTQGIRDSLIVDKEGNRYVGIETIMLFFGESKPTAYRRLKKDFKNPNAIFHSSFVESIVVPGQRATTSGVTIKGFAYYLTAIEVSKDNEDNLIQDIQYTKDRLMSNGSVSQESLISKIHFLGDADGQVISELKSLVASTAIRKVTNPFKKNEISFVAGKTYLEFLEWLKIDGNEVIQPDKFTNDGEN